MTKLIIEIPAQKFEVYLDDYKEDLYDEESGEWDEDGVYDGFVHEIISQPDYEVRWVHDEDSSTD